MEYIKLEDCQRGKIYRIKARNFSIGVFDGQQGFIGVRNKFDYEFLATEYHYDAGDGTWGTAKPFEIVGEVPSWIDLKEELGTICTNCGRPCKHIPDRKEWEHIPWKQDTNPFDLPTDNEDDDDLVPFDFGDCKVRPGSLANSYLFDFMYDLKVNKEENNAKIISEQNTTTIN